LFEGGFEVFQDVRGDDVGSRKVRRVFEGLVFEPKDIEVDLVALDEVVVGKRLETFAFRALVTVLGVIAGNELVQVGALQLVFFQGEVLGLDRDGAEPASPTRVSQRNALFRDSFKKRSDSPYGIGESSAIDDAGRDIHLVLCVCVKSNV